MWVIVSIGLDREVVEAGPEWRSKLRVASGSERIKVILLLYIYLLYIKDKRLLHSPHQTPSASLRMTVHSIWVINKAGGLVFSRSYSGTSSSPVP
jgi:hypothetical protein